MIVLDASVIIAHMIDGDLHPSRAMDILDTEEELAVHSMTMAESLVGPVRIGRGEQAREAIARLGIEQLASPPDEPLELARIRVDTGLKLPDCCVLAAALHTSATLATFDIRLAEAARGHGLTAIGAA